MTACTARMNAVHGAFEATRVVRKIQAHRHVARRPTPLAIHPTQPAMRRTPARAPTITTHSTGPERPVGPFSRRDQARFDAYGEIEHDDFDDLEDDLFDDDLDAPSRGSSALTGAGGTFLRVVVGFLALWCWRIAPTGCAWGVIVAGKLVRSPIFGSPFQWFATSFVVSSVSCVALLALTRKKFGTAMNQPRRSDGVPSHNVGIKAATPTMGGAALVPAGLVCALVFNKFADPTVWALSASTAALCVVGVVDDLAKLRGGTADVGLPPWAKLVCQSAVASVLCVWLASGGAGGSVPNTTVALLSAATFAPIGRWFWALAAFTIVAESNAVNVTDGLDGLAASTVSFALVAVGMMFLSAGRPELASYAVCVAGAACGFLVVNRHPASVFMGDTGSLALGGALGGLMACGGGAMVLPVFVASGVFVVESVSVILQKVWFRWTKWRTGTGVKLLKMSPLHHHLELSGWGEMKIVGWFAACGAACSVLAIRVFYMGAT